MARLNGKDLSSLSVDDSAGSPQSLLAETIALNFEHSAETEDTHTLGDDDKESTPGLKGGDEFTHEVFYNNTASTGTYALYTGRLGGVAGTISWGDGTRTTSMETLVTKLSSPIKVGEMMKLTATHKITGAVTYS